MVLTAVVHGDSSLFGCYGVLIQLDCKHGGDILLRNFYNYLPVHTESRPNGLSLQELNPCRRTYLFIDHADYSSVSVSNDVLFRHLDRIIESKFFLQNVHEIKDDALRIALLIQVTQRELLFAENNKETFSVTDSQFARLLRTQVLTMCTQYDTTLLTETA